MTLTDSEYLKATTFNVFKTFLVMTLCSFLGYARVLFYFMLHSSAEFPPLQAHCGLWSYHARKCFQLP